ncbi:MAG TPA: SRPBCC domain-containing protein [Candidatus Acidoferrales bacterium]|nr:SRPBCC domain-containing protein [Candidatus Acidoferrales bacterium]HTX57237.1 SRPBCC domain-containing protein [Candidatus Acidoferrales bacterium]
MSTLTIPSDREFTFEYTFDAPRALVWEVMFDPKHIPNWWGPARLRTVVDKMDFRPGGTYRFLQYEPDGTLHAFNGEYLEIVKPQRVVMTFRYEPWPDRVSRATHTLLERDGRTTLIAHQLFETPQERDNMLEGGAKAGYDESMQRLEALLRRAAELA